MMSPEPGTINRGQEGSRYEGGGSGEGRGLKDRTKQSSKRDG